MSAAAADRYGERQPSEYTPYSGASGYTYYKHTYIMHKADGTGVAPAVQGTGCSGAHLLGVLDNGVNLSEGLGASQETLNIWKKGEFTFEAQGTGASAHIGQRGYLIDDQTVGVSAGIPCLVAGEIVGLPSASEYRVRIDNAVGLWGHASVGLSWTPLQN